MEDVFMQTATLYELWSSKAQLSKNNLMEKTLMSLLMS